MKHRNPGNMDRIIAFVNDFYRDNHKSPSARQISAGTGIPRTTLQRMMRTMAENGRIHYDGENVFTDLSGKGSEETVSVGIIGSIPCGNLSLEEEAIEEIVQLPTAIFFPTLVLGAISPISKEPEPITFPSAKRVQ